MEQQVMLFEDEEQSNLKSIVKRSYFAVKKRFPSPTKGESIEEYNDFIRDETLLEIAERLKDIALKRQRKSIDVLYKGIKYDR